MRMQKIAMLGALAWAGAMSVTSWAATPAAGQAAVPLNMPALSIGESGQQMFAYGASRPSINCSPLHLCVVELIKGEKIVDMAVGDSVRWRVAQSLAGDLQVIVIKPTAADLETNLTVTTDAGRVYFLTLHSVDKGYMPLVGFYDPQALVMHVRDAQAARKADEEDRRERKDATLGALDPASLDFDYTCEGKAPFAAEQVFSAAGHVYVKMPASMQYGDAPAAFDTSTGVMELINSRFAHGYNVLDGLPEKFRLVSGVGRSALSVDCEHHAPEREGWHVAKWLGGDRR